MPATKRLIAKLDPHALPWAPAIKGPSSRSINLEESENFANSSQAVIRILTRATRGSSPNRREWQTRVTSSSVVAMMDKAQDSHLTRLRSPAIQVPPMSQHFQLPCPSCGSTVVVSQAQAGREVSCPSCNTINVVPTLRKLRELEPAEAPAGKPRSTREWQSVHLSGLSTGLAILFLGIILAGTFGLLYSRLNMEIPAEVDANRQRMMADVEQAPADQLFILWKSTIRSVELTDQPPNDIVDDIKRGRLFFQLIVAGLVVTTIGLGTTLWFWALGLRSARSQS